MSLDVSLHAMRKVEVYSSNITHNLGKMAREAGIYFALWRPEEIGAKLASDIIPLLEKGLADLKAKPDHFKMLDAPNGYGRYCDFVPFVEQYLAACKENPDAEIRADR